MRVSLSFADWNDCKYAAWKEIGCSSQEPAWLAGYQPWPVREHMVDLDGKKQRLGGPQRAERINKVSSADSSSSASNTCHAWVTCVRTSSMNISFENVSATGLSASMSRFRNRGKSSPEVPTDNCRLLKTLDRTGMSQEPDRRGERHHFRVHLRVREHEPVLRHPRTPLLGCRNFCSIMFIISALDRSTTRKCDDPGSCKNTSFPRAPKSSGIDSALIS